MDIKTIIISTVVTLLASACVSRAAIPAKYDLPDKCTHLNTCANCTQSDACHWSARLQACVRATRPATGNLTAIRPFDCPRIWVTERTVAADEFEYRVRVARDRIGLLAYLRDRAGGVTCAWQTGVRVPGRVTQDPDLGGSGEIACGPVRRNRFGDVRHLPFVRHFRVAFGADNVTLRLDDEADYYTAFYRDDCTDAFDDYCVNCLWTDDQRRYYLKTCSANNRCAVQPSMKLTYVNSQYLKDDAGRELAWPADVRTRCDRDIAVVSFRPTQAAWDADPETVMTVRVKNMGVLAEHFFVWEVTVAGKHCTDVRMQMAGDGGRVTDVLTCRLSLGRHVTSIGPGPVQVRFVAAAAGGATADATATAASFVVSSAAAFRFLGPVVTGATGPACGSLRGGRTLTVAGSGLAVARNVTVYVYRSPAGPRVPCTVIGRDDGRVTCVTGRTGAPSAAGGPPGPVTVAFDGRLELTVPGAAFAYAPDPVPTAAQTLSGIAAGGTVLQVHWRGMACVEPDSVVFYAQRHDGHRHNSSCRPVDASLTECRSPDVHYVPAPIDGYVVADVGVVAAVEVAVERFRCGFRMRFAGHPYHVECDPSTAYYAYANPMFDGFEVARGGTSVVIVGRDAGLGYGPDDVSVWLALPRMVACDVWRVKRDRVECRPTEVVSGAELEELWVDVGDSGDQLVRRFDKEQSAMMMRDADEDDTSSDG